MVFASYIFLFYFLPICLAVYYLAPRRSRELVLTVASYIFYGWWRPDFTLLMLFSTVVDYHVGKKLHASSDKKRRNRLLMISVCVNLGLLGYFKYWNFGIENLNAIIEGAGMTEVSWPTIVLPVGISFYTFQTMSYTLDIHRRVAKPVDSAMQFACYVALFPQLVAGPIVRYNTLANQLKNRTHTFSKFASGAQLFQLGFAKKILIADSLAPFVDQVFAMDDAGCGLSWLGLSAYTFQIYFDFSGYSDMAIGLGRMFGFEFPINFNSPYKSDSITDFWRRWHISLSTWLRDYLYIPLGGNKKGSIRTYVNLAATMLLGGLWHGAAWTYIAWGAYQGFFLIVERAVGKRPLYYAAPSFVRIVITFILAMIGWLFFRANTMTEAMRMLSAMFLIDGVGDMSLGAMELTTLQQTTLVASIVLAWFVPNTQELQDKKPSWLPWFALCLFIVAIGRMIHQGQIPFLYFQF